MREQEFLTLREDLDHEVFKLVASGPGPMGVAEKIAEQARATAPVLTGAYRDGITAERTPFGARVIASDEKSSWIEFGRPNHDVPAQFILRRAVDALGLKFKKGRRY
jgi:hypothetical protein